MWEGMGERGGWVGGGCYLGAPLRPPIPNRTVWSRLAARCRCSPLRMVCRDATDDFDDWGPAGNMTVNADVYMYTLLSGTSRVLHVPYVFEVSVLRRVVKLPSQELYTCTVDYQ